MADLTTSTSADRGLLARLSRRNDSEHEQAAIRVAIGVLLLLYYWLATLHGGNLFRAPNFGVLGTLFLLTIGIFLHVLVRPVKTPWRRIAGIVLDASAITYFFFASDESAVPMYALYLWIIFGNGFRYGRRYLYLALVLSLGGFGAAVLLLPHWHENQPLGWGLWGGMLAVSLYVAHLVKRLTTALQSAEAANMAKRRFVSSISHELRTPLNAIIGMADLMYTTRLDRDQQDMVHTLHEASCLMLSLIEDVLDFSKIEAGKLMLETVEFDLIKLVQGTIDVFRYQAQEKHIALTSNIEPGIPAGLVGDPRSLRQILVNLLSNAIKFTDSGEVACRVFCIKSGPEIALIRFEVADTGIGMSEQTKRRIFDSFTQADESMTRRYGGTGLGTTIAKQLVELMGGKIRVSSTPGKGSLFSFEIPLKKSSPVVAPMPGSAANAAMPAASALPANRVPAAARSLYVLVAEDNPTNSKVVQQILQRAGHRHKLATNGEKALDYLIAERFDIALLDMNMPLMNGLEVAKAYRFIVTDSDRAPVIMFSANATKDARHECSLAGVDAFLSKPVQIRPFLSMLEELAHEHASNPGSEDQWSGHGPGCKDGTASSDLDPAVLADLETLGSDPGFVELLLAGYMKDNSALVVQFESALHGQRFQDCRELLHAMKGSAVSVGALRMREFCERSEQLTAANLFHDRGEQVIQECQQVFSALCTQLNLYCMQRKVAPAVDSQQRPSE